MVHPRSDDRLRRQILGLIGVSAAADEQFDPEAAATELGAERSLVVDVVRDLETEGLALFSEHAEEAPLLTSAGEQYLAGVLDARSDALRFLPHHVDDLHARLALLKAGTAVVEEFLGAIVDGRGDEFADLIVPPAFKGALDVWDVQRLFAASSALMARLSEGRPAGCVAEEIVAVTVMSTAESLLEASVDDGSMSAEDGRAATSELNGLFELFQDADVLNLFDMKEPGDAAVAGHSFINEQAGIADQRLDSWWAPFNGLPVTGHLVEGAD